MVDRSCQNNDQPFFYLFSIMKMNPLKRIVLNMSVKARKQRAEVFRECFSLDENTKILDLGSENGSNIHNILQNTDVKNENVYIADIDDKLIATGEKNFGFKAVLISEDESLPFTDKYFDIVYCSSVIEHVTIAKSDLWNWKGDKKFKAEAFKRQIEFAVEVRRLGRQYFVQTPSKYFPIESHTWLPLVGYLPREMFLPVLKLSNKIWIKRTEPDFNLLNENEMQDLFPDSKIVGETKFGLMKSIMAIKSEK